MSSSVFKPTEYGMAIGLAILVEVGLAALLMAAGAGTALSSEQARPPPEIPIAVTPVIEDVPLLKYGSKPKEQQLPDMWRKPKPKKVYEDKSAPSVDADKAPKALPTNEVAKSDETPAPEDAELAKKVDEDLEDEDPEETPNLTEEGHESGVIGGTETDALKAFVISQYKAKLIAWFKAGFTAPNGIEFCDIGTVVLARLSGDRTVTGYSLQPSGNATLDAKVRAHMDGKVGRQVPPPPPGRESVLEQMINLKFSGENSSCKDKSASKPAEPSEDSPKEAPAAPDPQPAAPRSPSPATGSDSDGLLE